MDENNFKIKLQAILDKIKSIANIKTDIKAIEPKLPKVKLQGTLDKSATQKELNAKIKSIKPKVKVDADTTQAEKKIKNIGKQKTKTTVTPTVDNTQVVSSLKQAQKETKTLWERFTSGMIDVNLVRMVVQRVTQAIREAIVMVKELDTIKTNIQMVSGISDSGVNAMMSSYNAMAKNLSSTTKDVAEAANEFLRMGESIENTNELIRSSQILSKVGMIGSADAASYLISSLKGYQVAAEDSLDVVSKLTSVDMEAAVSAGGLAEALSKCSNIANNSGVAMNRLIGYTVTIGETTQKSMSEVGNSFQALLSRMNNIKIGRFIDDETGESLSDTEAVLNKLGIQLRDTEDSYRSFDDVLDDVGSRWKDFSKVEQNAISVAIAGTRQRENFEALMNNYGNALKYAETAANSAGSALERYGVYQDSIEAKTNELTAAMESLSTNVISEELYSGIIEATTGVVEFIDKANLLKGTLAGLVTMGISKAFVSMATGIISATKSTIQLTAAMKLFDKGRSVSNLKAIGKACIGLNDSQLKLVLSTKGLKTQQRLAILEGMGVEKSERQQTLATLGFAAAEDKATVSTFSLKGALNSLRTVIAMNPIGAIATAVSAVTIAFSVYKQHQEEVRQATEEAANAYKESSKSIDDYASKYQELHKALIAAKGNEEETYSIKKQLLELQTELNDRFGDEYGTINLVTEAYKDQTEVIKALNKETAQTFLNENKEGIDKSEKEMTKERHYNLSYTGLVGNTDKGEALKEIAEKYKVQGITLLDEYGDGSYLQFSVHLDADAQSAYETINAFENDLRDKAKELGNEHMFDDVLDVSSDSLNKAKETIEKYGDTYRQDLTAEIASDDDKSKTYGEALKAVETYNEAVLRSENPYDDQNVVQAKENLDAIKTSIQDNETEWGKYSSLFDDVFGQADTRLLEFNEALKTDSGLKELAENLEGLSDIDLKALNENVGDNNSFDKLKEAAAGYKINVDELIDALVRLGYVQGEIQSTVLDTTESIPTTISSSIQQIATQLEPQFTKLGEAYKAIFTTDGFTLNDVDNSMLENLRKSFAEIENEVGVAFDSSKLESFFNTLTNGNSSAEQVQQAFNELATAYLYSTDTLEQLNAETADAIEKQLEEMGVQNAAEVVTEALTAKTEELIVAKEYLTQTGKELASATEEERTAFILEQIEAGNCGEALALLQLKKVLLNQSTITTAVDCQNILALAQTANIGIQQLQQLQTLMNIISQRDAAVQNGDSRAVSELNRAINEFSSNVVSNLNLENIQVDFGNIGGGKSVASKAGKKAADAYLDAFEKELKELDELHSNGLISEKEYLDRLRVLYERYFKDKLGYEKEFAKYQKKYLDGYKSLYESVFSHASTLLSDRIDAINDEKDAAIDSLEAQKKAAEDSYNAQIKLLEDKKDALQAEIDKIKEANEDRKEAIDLQKAEYELARMQNQRTILQYSEDKGMHYVTDTSGIRDAKNDLDDKKADAQIRELEKQQDALDKQIDAIQEMLDASNEYWDAQIEQTKKYYDAMIQGMEEYRSRWEELSDLQEHAEIIALLKELGYTEEDLLNSSSGAFDTLRTSYLGILKDMNDGNQGVIDGLSQLVNIDMSNIPSFLAETQGYIDSIANMDVTALSDGLEDVSKSFSNVADSASGAIAAISGNGETSSGNNVGNNPSGKGSTNNRKNSANNGSSLKDAITEASTGSVEEINKISDAFAGEGDGTKSVTGAVKKIVDVIGNEDKDSDSLVSTLSDQTEQALDEKNGIPAQKIAWEELNKPLGEAVESVTTLKSTLTDMDGKDFTVTLNVIGNGSPNSIVSEFSSGVSNSTSHGGGGHSRIEGTGHAEGTVGKAFAEGTGKYKGLPHAEKNALVSEYGQTEMTVLPDGKTIITDEPTMMDLPKDTVIYNEEQTKKIMDNKVDVSGNAHSNGIGDDGAPLYPSQEILDFTERMKKLEMQHELIANNTYGLLSPVHIIKENMENMIGNISNVNVTNNRNIQQPVTIQIGDINLTGVQDVNGLSQAIKTRLPGQMMQEYFKN